MDLEEIGRLLPQLRTRLVELWGEPALRAEVLDPLVAIALVEKCWRNTDLENWHASAHAESPADFDMFRANITLTRAALPIVTSRPLDVEGLRQLFTDPLRPTGVGRTAREFCGPSWPEVEITAQSVLDVLTACLDELGEESTRVLYAGQASSSGWWGHPGFEDRLRASFASHRPDVSDREVAALVERPEEMSEQLFTDVVFYRL